MNRLLRNPYGAIVFGLLVLVVGFMTASPEVTCDGVPMTPEQTCTQVVKGKTVTLTYDQERQNGLLFTWIMFGCGTLMTIGGTIALIRRGLRRRTAG